MSATAEFTGIHHVSAVTARVARNHAFYTQVMGLRLVKRTVNQEDPGMYHLFYGDQVGSPGSDLTFFDLPLVKRERRGAGGVARTTLRVTGAAALEYWSERLADALDAVVVVTERDGRPHLDFEDPDGVVLSLVDDGGGGPRGVPRPGSAIPPEHQVQGLGYSGFIVADMAPTREFLERGLALRAVRAYELDGHPAHVFNLGGGGAHAELHVTERADLPRRRHGAGGVHHVALRVRDETELEAWARRLAGAGYPNTGVVDRYYFHSLYVTDPNGLIIELATDGPGFAIDEPVGTLGERLALPPFLEGRRPWIEARLRPIE